MKKYVLFFAFYLASFINLTAQSQRWFTYTDGRPVSAVEEFNGTYWISTLGGLVYFTDPDQVYHLDQNNSPVITNKFSAMDMDTNGGLWLGTMDGDIYNYINGQWTLYSDAKTRKHSVLRVDKIVVDHNNQVWFTRRYMDPPEESKKDGISARAFGEDYELVKLEGQEFKRQKIKATSVFDISLGTDNSLLLATNTGLKVLHNKLKQIDLPEEADPAKPYTALLDGQGSYWVSSGRWTWKQINGNWEVQKIYSSGNKKFSIPTESFDVVNDKEIAINAGGEFFMGNADQWTQVDREKLKEQFGRNINLDYSFVTRNGEHFANTRIGLIWFRGDQPIVINTSNSALRGATIHRLEIDESNTIHFKSEDLAFTINESEWTGKYLDHGWEPLAFKRLSEEDKKTIHQYVKQKMKSHMGDVVAHKDGSIWIATNAGLISYKNGNFQVYDKSNTDLPSTRIFGLAVALDDALWIGLDSGVVEWKNNIMRYHPLESQYAGAQHKKICFHPDGRVFVSGIDGFHVYERAKWKHISEELPRNKTINDMVVDMNGTLWLGTYGSGIIRFDENGLANITNEESGLSNNTIFAMDVDQYNNIWLGTHEGLCVFNESGLVGQVAKDGASPYYRVKANSPYSVHTHIKSENTTDLKLQFTATENLFTQIELYPNPTPGLFTVELSSVKEAEVIYRLFSLDGHLLQEKKGQGNEQQIQMDLSGQASGTYLLKIQQQNIVIGKRIIKI